MKEEPFESRFGNRNGPRSWGGLGISVDAAPDFQGRGIGPAAAAKEGMGGGAEGNDVLSPPIAEVVLRFSTRPGEVGNLIEFIAGRGAPRPTGASAGRRSHG